MAAGRADHKDGADVVMNSVRLRDCDGSLQIDINIILVLHTRVVDDNIKRRKCRILFSGADIKAEMSIRLLSDRSFLSVKSGNVKAFF